MAGDLETACMAYTALLLQGKISCRKEGDKLKVKMEGSAFHTTTAFSMDKLKNTMVPVVASVLVNAFQLSDNNRS